MTPNLARRVPGFACIALLLAMILIPPVTIDPVFEKTLFVVTDADGRGYTTEGLSWEEARAINDGKSSGPSQLYLPDPSGPSPVRVVRQQDGPRVTTDPLPADPRLGFCSIIRALGPAETSEGILGIRYAQLLLQIVVVIVLWVVSVPIIDLIQEKRSP